MTVKILERELKQDSTLKESCINVLQKALAMFIDADERVDDRRYLNFKLTETKIFTGSGICSVINTIIAYDNEELIGSYEHRLLKTYLREVILSGFVDDLISEKALFHSQQGYLPSYWFDDNFGKSKGYYKRIAFLEYCIKRLKQI